MATTCRTAAELETFFRQEQLTQAVLRDLRPAPSPGAAASSASRLPPPEGKITLQLGILKGRDRLHLHAVTASGVSRFTAHGSWSKDPLLSVSGVGALGGGGMVVLLAAPGVAVTLACTELTLTPGKIRRW